MKGKLLLPLLLLAVALFFVSSLDVNSNNAFWDDKDGEVGQSNARYQKLMDSFEKTYGYHRYPDYYGGCVIDANGKLIVQVTQDSAKIRSFFYDILESRDIVFTVTANSYEDIMREYDHWNDLLQNGHIEDEKLKAALTFLSGYYVDEQRNSLTFELTDSDPGIRSVILEHALSPSAIRFE